MRLYRSIAYFLILLSFSAVVAQDAACGATVQQALDAVGNSCEGIGRNQACYGYVSLQATPRDGVQNFNFTQKGDLVSVADIDTLRLSRFDPTTDTWGIALMKLQASLPDSLPGQNVTFLVFGDVQIQNATTATTTTTSTEEPTSLQVSADRGVNIRGTPSATGTIIGTFAPGDTATANGRNADGSWLQIQLPESTVFGWVLAHNMKVSGDVTSLAVVDETQAQTQYTPMQAFYFSTGITQTGCEEAPQDGILIQTPKGVGKVNMRANDVDVQLGSTAYLQAQVSGNMTVSVVEGEGQITAQGVTVDVPAGTFTTIPMDANLQSSGAPTPAQPYDPALVASLPIRVLPDPITIAPPLTATAEATQAGGGAGSLGPFTVQKIMNLGGEELSGSVCSLDQPFGITFQADIIIWTIQFVPTDASSGTYSYSYSVEGAGETATGEGTYTVADASADGSRTLTFDGTQTNKFNGGNPTMQLHYSLGLIPSASC